MCAGILNYQPSYPTDRISKYDLPRIDNAEQRESSRGRTVPRSQRPMRKAHGDGCGGSSFRYTAGSTPRADVPHRNRDHRAFGAVRLVHSSIFPTTSRTQELPQSSKYKQRPITNIRDFTFSEKTRRHSGSPPAGTYNTNSNRRVATSSLRPGPFSRREPWRPAR